MNKCRQPRFIHINTRLFYEQMKVIYSTFKWGAGNNRKKLQKKNLHWLAFRVKDVSSTVLRVCIFVFFFQWEKCFFGPKRFLVQYHEWPLCNIGLALYCQSGIRVFMTLHSCMSLQVPQHYKLMGYKPVSVYDALHNYISPELARPLIPAPPVTKHLVYHKRSKTEPHDVFFLKPHYFYLGWAGVWWGPVSTNSAP